MRTINDKTIDASGTWPGGTAVSVDERIINYDLIGSNAVLKTYVAYYDASGVQIGEENHDLSDVIDSGTKSALVDALETAIGETATTAELIIANTHISRIEFTTAGDPEWGIETINTSSLIPEFDTILGLMASAGGYSVNIDKTIQTIADQSRYNAFGNVFQLYPSQLVMPFRSGTDHIANGQIRLIFYDVATDLWHDRETFQTPEADTDYRDPKASVIGGEKILLFTSKYKPSNDTFYSMGYFLSDSLNTNDWGSYTTLTPPVGCDRMLTFTPAIETETAGTYYAAAYGFNSAGTTFKVWLWEIEYASGVPTFSIINVYSGSTQITECALEKLGSGKWIIVARVNNRNQMVQFTSSDDGATWSSAADTDMGVSGNTNPCVPCLRLLNGSLICLYQDRATDKLRISKADPDDVFANPLNWNPVDYEDNHFLGYPWICNMPGYTDRAMVIWAEEAAGPGSSSAIIYGRVDDFNDF